MMMLFIYFLTTDRLCYYCMFIYNYYMINKNFQFLPLSFTRLQGARGVTEDTRVLISCSWRERSMFCLIDSVCYPKRHNIKPSVGP